MIPVQRTRRRTWTIAVAAAICLAGATVPATAGAQVQPYGTNDYGGFRNVLPPGTNGLDNITQLGVYEATGARPRTPAISCRCIPIDHGRRGVSPPRLCPTTSRTRPSGCPPQTSDPPRAPSRGRRSSATPSTACPTSTATARELMFAIGYATAEDRLFFIDALRHAGNGDLAAFAGGANVVDGRAGLGR